MIDNVKRPLRILYVDTESFWRGGQEQLFSLMVGIRKRGHDVELAAPAGSPLANRTRDAGILTHSFTQRSELSLSAAWKLIRIMGSGRVDMLHYNTPRPVLAGKLAAMISGVSILVASRRVNFPLRSRVQPDQVQPAPRPGRHRIRKHPADAGSERRPAGAGLGDL